MIKPLPNEPPRAFALFQAYVAMGPDRSIRKAVKALGVPFDRLKTNSVRWKWQKRIAQHMIDDAQQDVDAESQAKLELAREREKRKEKIQEDAWLAGQEAIQVARSILRNARGNIKPTEAAKLLGVGDSLCRLSLGMAVTRGEITGAGGEPLSPSAPPVITVVHQYDDQSKKVDKMQQEFIDNNPNDPAVKGRNGSRNGQ